MTTRMGAAALLAFGLLTGLTGAATDQPAVKISRQFGAERRDFNLGAYSAMVILPSHPAADGAKPWLWYAPHFPGAGLDWLFKQLLDHGFAIAAIQVGESYGSPEGRAAFTQLHAHLVKTYGLSPKACLLPQSRGGLMLYNWAAENPDKVQCIGGIYTVCDLTSYPGLKKACGAYHLTEAELQQHLAEHNPIDRLAPLARAQIPILHVHGDSDRLVPLERNSAELLKRYQALGGPGRLIVIPGKGHQVCPEFFENPALAAFFLSGGRDLTAQAAPVLNAAEFKDKVLACWVGKNIGGTLGAPIPNDDLDLQLVWLQAMEEHQFPLDTCLLGDYWLKYVRVDWAEYGVGKRNFKLGIMPPPWAPCWASSMAAASCRRIGAPPWATPSRPRSCRGSRRRPPCRR